MKNEDKEQEKCLHISVSLFFCKVFVFVFRTMGRGAQLGRYINIAFPRATRRTALHNTKFALLTNEAINFQKNRELIIF